MTYPTEAFLRAEADWLEEPDDAEPQEDWGDDGSADYENDLKGDR